MRPRYIGHGEEYVQSVSCPQSAHNGSASSPLPPSRPVPRRYDAHQGDYEQKTKETTKESVASPYSSPADAMNEDVGGKSGSSPQHPAPPPSSPLPTPCAPALSF